MIKLSFRKWRMQLRLSARLGGEMVPSRFFRQLWYVDSSTRSEITGWVGRLLLWTHIEVEGLWPDTHCWKLIRRLRAILLMRSKRRICITARDLGERLRR